MADQTPAPAETSTATPAPEATPQAQSAPPANTPAPGAEPGPEAKRLTLDLTGKKFKVNGKEILADSLKPEELDRRLQMGFAAEQAMQRAAYLEKQHKDQSARMAEMEARFAALEKDPKSYLRESKNIDIEADVRNQIISEHIAKNGTPEEKAAWELRQRGDRAEALEKELHGYKSKEEKAARDAEYDAEVERFSKYAEGMVMQSIEAVPELKIFQSVPGASAFVGSQALFYVRSAERNGIQLTPEKLGRFVHRDVTKLVNLYLENQKEDVLEKEIPPAFWQKWDKYKQAKIATPNHQPPAQTTAPAPRLPEPDKSWDDVWGTRKRYQENIPT